MDPDSPLRVLNDSIYLMVKQLENDEWKDFEMGVRRWIEEVVVREGGCTS